MRETRGGRAEVADRLPFRREEGPLRQIGESRSPVAARSLLGGRGEAAHERYSMSGSGPVGVCRPGSFLHGSVGPWEDSVVATKGCSLLPFCSLYVLLYPEV